MTPLTRLIDDAEIRQIIASYAHACDARDVDAVLRCFEPGARVELEGGATAAEGHDRIRSMYVEAFAGPALASPATSTHVMSNTIIEVDGDRAHAETAAVAFLASATRGVVIRGLRYSDEFVRTGSGWRIGHRLHRLLWQTETPGQAFPTEGQ